MCNTTNNKSNIFVSDHNRSERKKIMDDMQALHDSMISVLDNFNGIKKNL